MEIVSGEASILADPEALSCHMNLTKKKTCRIM